MSRRTWSVVKRFCGLVAVAAVALACVLVLTAPAGASSASPFREIAVVKGALYVGSDGVRFAWATQEPIHQQDEVVHVFDTLHGRNFPLTTPEPGCSFYAIGGGFAVWGCPPANTWLLTNLSTARIRKVAGIQAGLGCAPSSIGRHWLEYNCYGGGGSWPSYLNHRTGRRVGDLDVEEKLFSPDAPFLDLDYTGLFRPYCAPLESPPERGPYSLPYFDYQPPFALRARLGTGSDSIRLQRCGTKRVEILGRCFIRVCRTPQLGSRYVTWGEDGRVYAYLPAIRRRVLVGRPPVYFLSVAHTCNQIFTVSPLGNTVYATRFEPARGAPPCQSKG
jgi:hypothetical protein